MSQEQKSALGSNVISLPKGGGAIAGMGETFAPDLFTGTGNFSVPIAVPPGRNGMQPSLTLAYSTGSGNGPFGLGWNLSLPGISRKTSLGIPQYDDEKDVFVLSGAEDLIPVERGTGGEGGAAHTWIRYQPRTEGLFARIVHFNHTNGFNFWEVRTKDGMLTYYGDLEEQKCIVHDPADPGHIAQWCILGTTDPLNNAVLYEYDRVVVQGPYPHAQTYLKKVRYANYDHEGSTRWLCSVELEYSDRPDPHSDFRQGFEIRTTRRCTAIKTYTHPLDADMPAGHTPNGTDENKVLVKTYKLTYRDELGHTAHNKVSQLANVQVTGHDGEATESLPPVEFEYQDFDITKRNLVPVKGDHLPALNLNHPDMDLVDLDGNGLPDFVQMSAGQPIRYWKNKGGGEFELPRTMRNAPTGLALGSEAVQLMDADGDGRVDLVMNAPNFAGYYSLDHDGEWDKDSFRPYATRPPVNLNNAQAQFIDLSGDGRTDVLINANRFECYFQNSPLLDTNRNFDGLQFENRAIGWSEARFVNKAGLEDFPNVNFGDPRIRTADMSGDGLSDIVQVQDGNIVYWPNLGYGRFGKRRQMRNSPRIGYGFNPAQLILGDADGDGQTDVIYVERNSITVWFNQSGNGFSEPVTIKGTPSFTSRDSVRMVDLMGTGTPGILWTYELGAPGAPIGARHMYLDLTGGLKPYVMVGMRNNLGARTRVQYGSSVAHYLRDTYRKPMRDEAYDQLGAFVGYAGKWNTTLPFPVQVVDRVEVIDEISKGKLSTRYFYHHGYWDGGEREFRGFGRVDQFDTETFDRYNEETLALNADISGVRVEHYAPPVLAKNWFHLGPVGKEKGEWGEVDFANEYWSGDRNMLQRDVATMSMVAGLPRRARRDAYRTLRGTALRSELYAMDGSPLQQRPYTVSETQTGLRLVASPNTNAVIKALAVQTHSNHIFFSYGLGSRSTTWERGTDPMTKFSFTGEIDAYGQPLSQISIAVPRGKDPLTGGELQGHGGVYDPERGYDATIQYTHHIYVVPSIVSTAAEGQYMVDRVKQARSYEGENNGGMSIFALRDDLLKPIAEWSIATPRLLGLACTYYDGTDENGDSYGSVGTYGVPVRTETLMVQAAELDAAYGIGAHPPMFVPDDTEPLTDPDWSSFPADFVAQLQDPRCGYTYHSAGGDQEFVAGYYTSAQRTRFDFHLDPSTAKGLPVNLYDVFGNMATVGYDSYKLLPVTVTDPLTLKTRAEYDYRLLQPARVIDPNENTTAFAYTPLGLMHKTALLGKVETPEGDTLDDPSVLLEYDLFAFLDRHEPVWVKTTQREHHINAEYLASLPSEQQGATIVAVEYSDGFGRQLQTRTQAEDLLFGNALLGDSGLPADQSATNGPAIGVLRDEEDPLNVVVSGAKLYNNKGKAVEQWEPYFSQGFELTDVDAQHGQRTRIYYDALGRPQRTVNPDGTVQLVVYGTPVALTLSSVKPPSAEIEANPWERYTYDASDLASLTHPSDTTVPEAHRFTPKSEVMDALGRTVLTTEHLAHYDAVSDVYKDVVMQYAYDIKGQLLKVIDPVDRVCFQHVYDTAGNNLWTKHLDSGERTIAVDAQGKPLYSGDAKGAAVYSAYDALHRPTDVWASDMTVEAVTLRRHLIYGDAEHQHPLVANMNGRLLEEYDEAGHVAIVEYDFKGNPLEKVRRVINDDELTDTDKYAMDWTGLDKVILDTTEYVTTLYYDALNRVRKTVYPEDLDAERKELVPAYNKAGTLQSLQFDDTEYVRRVGYNAKGQRILITTTRIMTRYAYDPLTFRLLRLRSEIYAIDGEIHTPYGNVLQDLVYSYDLGGNIIGIRDQAPDTTYSEGPGDLLRQFAYDPLKRLLSATGRESTAAAIMPSWDMNVRGHDHTATNTYTRAYQYDKLGNVLQEQHTADSNPGNSFTKTFEYDATPEHNKLVSFTVGATTYDHAYDACGNLLTENTDRHHQWGFDDRLRLFKIAASGTASKWAHYCYDSSGQRVKKLVNKTGGIQEVTIYIDGVYEHSYTKNSGTIDGDKHYNALHVMDGRSRIATIRVGTDVDDDKPAIQYFLEDHLGTACVVYGEDGLLINREEYYPFGESCFGAFAKKRYRYVGKEKDNESGLYYYGARYYAAWTCRFVSVDPLADKYPQLTPYNYAANDPIGDLDIDGMQNTKTAEGGGGGGGTIQVPDALQVKTPDVSLLPNPKLDTATIGSVIVKHQGKEPIVLGSTDEIYGLLGVTRQGPFVEVISEILANDLLRENGTITFSDLGPYQGGPVNSGGLNQSLDSPIGVRFGVTFQGFDEQGCAADLYTEISVPVTSVHHGSVSDVALAVLAGRLSISSKVTSASRNAAAAAAVKEAKVLSPAALPAPRQVTANWGMNTYKHGGEMYAIEHIMYRHASTSGFTNVSRFAEGMGARQIQGLVDDALRYGNQTKAGTFEYNFGRAIGTNQGGGAANGLRVIVRDGNIQTAFPITIP